MKEQRVLMFFTVSIFTFQAIHQAQPNPARQFKPLACRFWTVKGNIFWPFFSFIRIEQDILTSVKNQNWTRRCFLSCYSGLYCSTVYTSILYIYRPWRYYFSSLQSLGVTGRTSPLSWLKWKQEQEHLYHASDHCCSFLQLHKHKQKLQHIYSCVDPLQDCCLTP